jgi:hypothetical protein
MFGLDEWVRVTSTCTLDNSQGVELICMLDSRCDNHEAAHTIQI